MLNKQTIITRFEKMIINDPLYPVPPAIKEEIIDIFKNSFDEEKDRLTVKEQYELMIRFLETAKEHIDQVEEIGKFIVSVNGAPKEDVERFKHDGSESELLHSVLAQLNQIDFEIQYLKFKKTEECSVEMYRLNYYSGFVAMITACKDQESASPGENACSIEYLPKVTRMSQNLLR